MLFEIGRDPAPFEGLKIAQEKELCEKYMGKFPVISISLKSVDGLKYDSAVASLKTVIGNEAGRFRFLRNSDRLMNDEKEAYAQLTEVGSSQGGVYTMTEKMAEASLQTLSLLLEKHYGQKAILLIDEYSWLVKSNAETGEGCSDISIQTPDRTGIVIELKYAHDGNLEKACGEALKQIEEKKYAEGLKHRGMKKIMKYGIAFYEKECTVMMG